LCLSTDTVDNNYEYTHIFENSINFDSYMINDNDIILGSYRLLEVDNQLVLPQNTPIRFLITSTDVIHSWAIPTVGIKTDACPGRVSTVWSNLALPGQYYGQCSEICGINHGFMPISIKVADTSEFSSWLFSTVEETITNTTILDTSAA
jgi:cytochrome c oxidase subunit 2